MANRHLSGKPNRQEHGLPFLTEEERLRLADPDIYPFPIIGRAGRVRVSGSAEPIAAAKHPLAAPNEVDVYSLDRYLDTVSENSQALYQDGYFGLLLFAGDEQAELRLDPSALTRISALRNLNDRRNPSTALNSELIDALELSNPIHEDELDFILFSSFALCRAIRFVWNVWQEALERPPPAVEAMRAFRALHSSPKSTVAENGFRIRTSGLDPLMKEWSNRVYRVGLVHPNLVLPEIGAIIEEIQGFRDKLVEHSRFVTSPLVEADTSHLGIEMRQSLRSWYISRRFGLKSTPIARRVLPHLSDGVKTARKGIKLADQHLAKGAQYVIDPILGSGYATMLADDLEAIVPRFHKDP